MYVPNLKTALKWCLNSILMCDKYCRKLASRLRASVISTSLWGDQMETDMSLVTVCQCSFINSQLPLLHIFHMCQRLLFQSSPVSLFKRLLQVMTWTSGYIFTCFISEHKLMLLSMFDSNMTVLFCPVSIVQEVAGGRAAAEDIVSPGHPEPLPRALQSCQLPCPQSWLPTSWRTIEWQLCKSNPTKKKCLRNIQETLTF